MGMGGDKDAWNALSEAERKEKEKEGMVQWGKWMDDHRASIVEAGGPLGKTKRTDREGVSDIKNEMGAYIVVQAASHEEAAKMFENHPHFTIFPGEWVETMEIMPMPTM